MVSSCFPDFGFCPIKPVLFMSLVPVPVFVFFCLFFWGGGLIFSVHASVSWLAMKMHTYSQVRSYQQCILAVGSRAVAVALISIEPSVPSVRLNCFPLIAVPSSVFGKITLGGSAAAVTDFWPVLSDFTFS